MKARAKYLAVFSAVCVTAGLAFDAGLMATGLAVTCVAVAMMLVAPYITEESP